MATLQVKEINDSLYDWLKYFAKSNNRSISQEVITILQEKASSTQYQPKNAVDEFLSLSGSWEDERETDEIVSDVISSRNNSARFGENDGLFD